MKTTSKRKPTELEQLRAHVTDLQRELAYRPCDTPRIWWGRYLYGYLVPGRL
jgi:hypothetical protein